MSRRPKTQNAPAAPLAPTAAPTHRHHRLDALRTLAMVWMTGFHLAFDLNHFGWVERQNFYADPFWTWQRTAIVSLFLFTAGLAQAVALHQQGLLQRPPLQRLDARFWRRWAQVAGAALLVSAGSALMFPNSWIYFGVLHGLAVMLLLARLSAGWGQWLWLAGGAVLALRACAQALHHATDRWHALHDPVWNWLGAIAQKPITEDHVPLLPWLAAVWWGLAAGLWVLRHKPHWLNPPTPAAWERRCLPHLALPGRWSLSYYLLHQPVLIGAILALGLLR